MKDHGEIGHLTKFEGVRIKKWEEMVQSMQTSVLGPFVRLFFNS